MIPYGRQSISEQDVQAVVEALRSDFLTSGPRVDEFEKAFADFIGAKHAIAVTNATAALHLAMLAGEVGKGDRVITSPNTFLSSANCAAFVGATPDFCDIEDGTYTMDPESLEAAWTNDVKAVVPVAFGGQSADMPAVAEIARERGALIVEDASHGTGGGFFQDGKSWKQGGHPWADMTVFSFHPVKTLTTGEGGILATDNDVFAARARALRSHGMTRAPGDFVGLIDRDSAAPASETSADPEASLREQGPWYYEMQSLGHNFRITDLQCALGLSQLDQLPAFMERRRAIVAEYNLAYAGLHWLRTPAVRDPRDAQEVSWHLYTVQIDFRALGKTRTEAMNELRGQGVGTQVLYIPVHLQPWYRQQYGYGPGKCPRAEAYYARALSLPLHPSMSDADVQRVIAAVHALAS